MRSITADADCQQAVKNVDWCGKSVTAQETFDSIYEQHSSYVYNTCLGILGNPDDARDAMQDTFIQLYRYLPKFRGESSFSTWLYRVAVSKCMDMLRKRRNYQMPETPDWLEELHSHDNTFFEYCVRQTILKLKPEHRAVLVLFHFQQLSYEEIADALNCSTDQVRARLFRARNAFRMLYDDGGNTNEL